MQVYGIDIDIQVQRHSGFYIVSTILPIMLTVYLCLLVFFLDPKVLEARLGAARSLSHSAPSPRCSAD